MEINWRAKNSKNSTVRFKIHIHFYLDQNEKKSDEDDWENCSDYDSNEEQTYQGDKIKKDQITSIIGSITKTNTNTRERKQPYDSSKNSK